MEQIYGIFALKLTGESPLFFQKCAKNRPEICDNLSSANNNV